MLTAINRPVTDVQTLPGNSGATPGCPELMSTYEERGNVYIFLKGVASGIYGAFVTYDELGVSTLLAANAFGPVAILMGGGSGFAAVASYGVPDATTKGVWALIFGSAYGKVSASFADNGKLYATATAGEADDAATAGDLVHNAVGRSAITTGYALCQVWYPFIDDDTDDNLGP